MVVDWSLLFFASAINPLPERVLPGRGSPFLEKGRKSTRGSHPWTPNYYGARKDAPFRLSSPFTPAIELLYRQSLRRNYERALNPGFCGDSTCDYFYGPFLPNRLPRPGYFHFLVQQLQEAAFTTHLKLLSRTCLGRNRPRVQGPLALVLSVRFPESGLPPGRA